MFSDVVDMVPRPMAGQSSNTGTTSRTHPPNRGATTGADNPTGLVIGSPVPRRRQPDHDGRGNYSATVAGFRLWEGSHYENRIRDRCFILH